MNDTINTKEKNNDVKGITFLAIGIMTIVAAIAGASYAFFQVTATNNNISGESAYTSNALTLDITHSTNSTVGTKKLIPQLSSAIESAVQTVTTPAESAHGSCIDTNGNAICKQYTLTVTNNTTTTFHIEGKFELVPPVTTVSGQDVDQMPNLRWRECTGVNTCPGTAANDKNSNSLGTITEIAGGTTTTFYVVVWINETGSAQTDNGTFSATVTFTGYNDENKTQAGITSTIRS